MTAIEPTSKATDLAAAYGGTQKPVGLRHGPQR